jgi:hypothetical protein
MFERFEVFGGAEEKFGHHTLRLQILLAQNGSDDEYIDSLVGGGVEGKDRTGML